MKKNFDIILNLNEAVNQQISIYKQRTNESISAFEIKRMLITEIDPFNLKSPDQKFYTELLNKAKSLNQ